MTRTISTSGTRRAQQRGAGAPRSAGRRPRRPRPAAPAAGGGCRPLREGVRVARRGGALGGAETRGCGKGHGRDAGASRSARRRTSARHRGPDRGRSRGARRGLASAARGVPAGADAPPPAAAPALALDFERLLTEADRLADEALTDADRLAQHKLETQRLDVETRAVASAQAEEARTDARRGEVERDWADAVARRR